MLRIHFTTADLQRIRWAAHPEPLMETVLSLQLLQQPQARGRPFARWSAQARRGIGPHGSPLLDLAAPQDGALTELLTAPTGTTSLTDALEAIRDLPQARVIADLTSARSMRADLPQWIVEVHYRQPQATEHLARLLHAYHRQAIAPAWPYLQHTIQATVSSAAATPEAVLSGLHPSISWQFPILTVPCHLPHDVDLHLAGRGLLLVPVFFLRTPTARLDNHDEQAPAEIYFPVRHSTDHQDDTYIDPGLTHLLGRTRATILAALTAVRGTTDLATHLGISAPTASHHLNALRAGGLITTVRQHGTARHSLTHLGLHLLHNTSHTPEEPT